MKIGIIILARMDSRRLPGKTLLDIAGRTLIGRVIDLCRGVQGVAEIILATSDRPVDSPLTEVAADEGIALYRGAVDDVAGRFLGAMRSFNLDAALRLNGDSPLNRPSLLTHAITIFRRQEGVDLVSNLPGRTFPFGVSAEVIGRRGMEVACELMADAGDREHVTAFFYKHPQMFTIHGIKAESAELAGVDLAVDQPTDLERIAWIIKRVQDPVSASLTSLVRLAREFDAKNKTGQLVDNESR